MKKTLSLLLGIVACGVQALSVPSVADMVNAIFTSIAQMIRNQPQRNPSLFLRMPLRQQGT